MPEGTPGGPEQAHEDGALFQREEVTGRDPEKPVDTKRLSREIGEAAAAADKVRDDREYHQQFLADRGLGPQMTEEPERPFDEIGSRRRDRSTDERIWSARAKGGAPGVRTAMDEALQANAGKPRPRLEEAVDDPHAEPKHGPERRLLAAEQVDASRRAADPFGPLFDKQQLGGQVSDEVATSDRDEGAIEAQKRAGEEDQSDEPGSNI